MVRGKPGIEVRSHGVYVVGLDSLECGNHGFESRREYEYPSPVFVECCVGSGLCDVPITSPEESYRVCVCVCACVCACTKASVF